MEHYNYITVREAAEKWGISARRVQILCNEGRIENALRIGHIWVIPTDAAKPTDRRVHTGSYRGYRSALHV